MPKTRVAPGLVRQVQAPGEGQPRPYVTEWGLTLLKLLSVQAPGEGQPRPYISRKQHRI